MTLPDPLMEAQVQLVELRAVVHQLAAALDEHVNRPLDHIYQHTVSPRDRLTEARREAEQQRVLHDNYRPHD